MHFTSVKTNNEKVVKKTYKPLVMKFKSIFKEFTEIYSRAPIGQYTFL